MILCWNHTALSQNAPIWKHKADNIAIFITLKTNAEHSSFYPEVIHRESTSTFLESVRHLVLPSLLSFVVHNYANGNEWDRKENLIT